MQEDCKIKFSVVNREYNDKHIDFTFFEHPQSMMIPSLYHCIVASATQLQQQARLNVDRARPLLQPL